MDENLKLSNCHGREKPEERGGVLRASARTEQWKTWNRRAEMCVWGAVSEETGMGQNLVKLAGGSTHLFFSFQAKNRVRELGITK